MNNNLFIPLNIQRFGGSLVITEAYEHTVDYAQNTSYIHITAVLTTNSTTYNDKAYYRCVVTGNGGYNFDSGNVTINVPKNANMVIVNREFGPIYHNSDGTASPTNINISSFVVSNTQPSANASVQMSTIPRTSTVTSSASDITLDTSFQVYFHKATSSFMQNLYVHVGDEVVETFYNIKDTSYTLTPTVEKYAPHITGRNTNIWIDCHTVTADNQYVGSYVLILNYIVPDNAKTKPVVDTISVTEANSQMKTLNWGIYVKNKSQLAIDITKHTLKYNASLSSYSIQASNEPNYSGKTYTTGYLKGNGSVNCYVTDSRGFTSNAKTLNYTVVDYENPVISNANVTRCTSTGKEDSEGEYIKYSFSGSISPCNNKNAKKFRIGYKLKTSSTYTYKELSTAAYTLSQENIVLANVKFDITKTYDFVFEVIDSFTTSSIIKDIETGHDVFNVNESGNAIAFGKTSEHENAFEISGSWDMLWGNKKLLDIIYPVGSVYISVNNTNPSTLFGGTWERISQGRTLMGEGTVQANNDNWCGVINGGEWTAYAGNTGGEVTHQLTVDELPSHNHGFDWPASSGSAKIMASATSRDVFGTLYTHNTGGDAPHNNMPPYLVVYIWKRTR